MCLDAPFVFEPGPDPDSIYAAPAKAKMGTKHPLQAPSHSAPPRPTSTTTHGGIGHTLSLSALSPPFKVMLMLPNPCVMSRDSHNAKTDMQTESLKFFVTYSTTHTTTLARGRERDEQLAQGKPFNPSIHSFVHLSPTVYADAQNLKN